MHKNCNKLRPHDWPEDKFETMRDKHKAFNNTDGYHILRTGMGNITHKDDVNLSKE